MLIPKEAVEKIVKNAGVEKISPDAIKELQKAIDEIGSELANEAAAIARKAGRKVILVEDIFLASGKQRA